MLPETPIIPYAREEEVDVLRHAMLAGSLDFIQHPADIERPVDSIRASSRPKSASGCGWRASRGAFVLARQAGAKGGVGKTTIPRPGSALWQLGPVDCTGDWKTAW